MGENKGGEQRRKRTLIHGYDTYDRAKDAEAALINEGLEAASELQVRRRQNNTFGLFRREAVK